MPIKLGFLLFVSLAVLAIRSESAVMSIDLGSEWVKVAVVNLKPGQPPISIAINEMSKRKSPSLVAFHSGDRLIGEEAAGVVARDPEKVYSQIRDLIGKPFDHPKRKLAEFYLPFDVVEDWRGVAAFRVDDGAVYGVEEMLAMVLGYAARLAGFHSKVAVKDAVISVPGYFGQAERKGVLQAAQLAGINVLSLVNEHSGAALQYGIDKNFANESRHVVFYDMGSSNTYAALVHYTAYNAKEYGKTVSINQFQVKDVRWNPELGGQDLELRLVEYFADEFNTQVGNGFDVRKYPKAMAKLKKQVKRTKEILSANTAAPISVESIYDDRDFRSTITREKFEELCADLWEKSLLPLKELLLHSGLKIKELHAVELIGGATRVPKLQAKLQEFLGRKELDKHLDADEAIVLGAALHTANLSDGIKLNRKLGIIDGATYGYLFELDGPDLVKDDNTKQVLVPRMKKVPSKMYRSIVHKKDFEVMLAYESEEFLPPGVSSPIFAHYTVSGLTDAGEKYSSRNLSAPIKANLHFSLSRSGVLTLDRAEAVIEISEWVEVPKKNLTLDNSTTTANISLEATASANLTADGEPKESSEESSDSSVINGGLNDASNSSIKEESSPVVMEKKLKRRTFRVPLKVIEKTTGPGTSLPKEALADAKGKLEALDKKDAERRKTAELKNNLEEYIYSTREKIVSSDEIEKVSTSGERESFIRKLDELVTIRAFQVQEWLYMDGEDASANAFQEHLDKLKAIGDPIFHRLTELTARPEAVENAKGYLEEVKEIVKGWETNKFWIPKERIDEILKESDKFKSWLAEKEAEQNKIPASSAPVLTSEEVFVKLFDLKAKVASVNRIPKPKPKVDKPVINETDSSKTESSSDSNTNSSEGSTLNQDDVGSSDSSADEAEAHDEL
ncbi:Heat shock 70 kDa protein 17-like protein [Drosera capensis]